MEAPVKTMMAVRKVRRMPKRSASQPEAGISMAIVKEYAMTTDCMRSAPSPRLLAIAGSAVLTMVASSVCMKKPAETSHSNACNERWVAGFAEAAGWMLKEPDWVNRVPLRYQPPERLAS